MFPHVVHAAAGAVEVQDCFGPLPPSSFMPAQTPDGTSRHGSIFRKKSRFHVGSARGPPASAPPLTEEVTATTTWRDQKAAPEPDIRPNTAAAASHPHKKRDSSISSITELRSNIRRRSTSLRSHEQKASNFDILAYTHSADQRSNSSSTSLRPSVSTVAHRNKSSESIVDASSYQTPCSLESKRGKALPHPLKREDSYRPGTAGAQRDSQGRSASSSQHYPYGSNPNLIYDHVQDLSSKRIATLDYLRKGHVHGGHVYWFNTLLFNKSDIAKLPYFEAQKLARRATNYVMLGVSIPALLDPNSNALMEYLRMFHALLSEFESYQSAHPPDGSTTSSLPKVRVPQVFKRAAGAARRSGAADSWMSQGSQDISEGRSFSGGLGSMAPLTPTSSLPGTERELLPGEEYNFLLTPSLPFEPDYFETFATLCDVLIDCYTRIMTLASPPEVCSPAVADLFSKVDGRVKKLLIAGIVRDLEDASKQGVRSEMAGVGKVVLGGLM